MIIEIEYYKCDTKIIGKNIGYSELNRIIMQAEEICDTAEDNFVRILCDLIQFEVIETYEQPDYIYDRDVQKLYKPRNN